MTHPEGIYESWKKGRARAEAPPGFADAVMNAVQAHETRRQQRWLMSLFFTLAASRTGRAGLMTFAFVVFALRLAAVVAMFLVNFANPLE